MNRLYLLRHAKSSWKDPALDDFDRSLNKRGEKACELLARHIGKTGIKPALVLCSPAKRTRQTLKAILPVWHGRVDAIYANEIYDANTETLHALLCRYAGSHDSIMLVGHNPALQELILNLCADDENNQYRRVAEKYPTGGLATLTAPHGPWSKMSGNRFTLLDFIRPRDLDI